MAHQMSADQIEEYTNAFYSFDKDGDGLIATKELEAVLKSIGQRPCESDLKELIQVIDKDGNGAIAFEEFLEMMTCLDCTSAERKEVLREAFRVHDKEGKGLITLTNLRYVIKIIGDKLTDEVVEDIIRRIVTKDELVNYEDFLSMISQLNPCPK
ncbi:hypothetical protein CHS0354_038992 [Potamilus streckersoni]|uniref:EF-hand domain-containing protein n=1 Tax=Potamilus streckersoni TaxID=2493646 RepID=A0AAE0S105_9BIVA|nr:hypothetical protein CHS0354_038992 [Potamilus streckersoni]